MKIWKVAGVVLVAAMVVLAMSDPSVARPRRVKPKPGQVQKTNNFALVLDMSAEMNVPWGPQGQSKAHYAKKIADGFIVAIPEGIPVKGAIYFYGVLAADASNTVVRVVKMQELKRGVFRDALNHKIDRQEGLPTLSWALKMVKDDLDGVQGRTAVIIISGGNKADWGKPSHEAQDLKRTYRDNVCIWTVLVGKSREGGRFLKGLVDDGKCGLATTADALESEKEIRRWTRSIFFGPGPDDADFDGVLNADDKCPTTPIGAKVDARGCWILNNIQFDTGKSDIKPEYFWILDEVASVMNANPGVNVTIVGHTDNVGSREYNQRLSQQRADSVKTYLMTRGEVDGVRLQTMGRGFDEPIADNATDAGRAMNRRIEFKPSSQ